MKMEIDFGIIEKSRVTWGMMADASLLEFRFLMVFLAESVWFLELDLFSVIPFILRF
jgi:hypothetical protein